MENVMGSGEYLWLRAHVRSSAPVSRPAHDRLRRVKFIGRVLSHEGDAKAHDSKNHLRAFRTPGRLDCGLSSDKSGQGWS